MQPSPPTSDVRGHVLVVDDDADTLFLMKRRLEKRGWTVHTSDSGSDALAAVAASPPDVIVCDYMMPGMDGPEVVRQLRQASPSRPIPVLMLTASEDPSHIESAMVAGANDYLVRPVDVRILDAKLRVASRVHQVCRDTQLPPAPDADLIRDLEEARNVQQRQLPDLPTRWTGWRLAGAVSPSRGIGGDMIARIPVSVDHSCVALVDVSGHGLAAAMVAYEVVATLRTVLGTRSLSDAMAHLNRALVEGDNGKYAVVGLAESGPGWVNVVNAGLPPIAHVRGNQVIHTVQSSGVPPGMLSDQNYQEERLTVQPGDRIVLLSDGLTEPFGAADDTLAALTGLGLLAADAPRWFESGHALSTVQSRFLGPQPDDATVAVLECIAQATGASRKFDAAPTTIDAMRAWVLAQLPAHLHGPEVEVGLTEALTNAVVHGALDIESRRNSLDQLDAYLKKTQRRVPEAMRLGVHAEGAAWVVRIGWKGRAAPRRVRRRPKPNRDPLATSGRGMALIYDVFDEVRWRDDGRAMDLVLLGETT